ncbi:MAG: 3-dehydroquinate synthase [Verrucomicrobiota bacterium]|jgi:3-dehydroquinate synthase
MRGTAGRFVKVTRAGAFRFRATERVGTIETIVNPVSVKAGEQSYDVFVGSRLLEESGALVSQKLKGPACAVISDDNVATLFAQTVVASLTSAGFQPTLLTIRPGEASKRLEEAGKLCDRMIEAGLDRTAFVVALGGGMVGDLAGFVAAIYHRGIPCVQVPTTLLAQVDSSIGGKTGVNTVAGKNLIGTWHQPALVISDVDALATLPPRELKQGFAEIVKHAVIRDAEMFEALQRFDRKELAALIRRNVEIKAAVVAADEHETTGERALLNFGHTVGHAIERAGDYNDFLHGEAVSLGIVAACEISVRKAGMPEADRARIIQTLEAFELPIRLPSDFPKEKILEAIRFDKKFAHGQVRFVVVPAIGSARLAADVTMEDIEAALKSI